MVEPPDRRPPHQERVIAEKADLDEKIEKLSTFLQGPVFSGLPEDEKYRLLTQNNYMQNYSNILGERIAAFEPPDRRP